MWTRDAMAVIGALLLGVMIFVVSRAAAAQAQRRGGRWASGARAVGTLLATLVWLVFVMVHLPITVVAILLALYPLLACEPNKAIGRRAALVAAAAALCVDAVVGLVRRQYGLPDSVWWTTSIAMLITPAIVGIMAWHASRRRLAA